ncbi:MAG: phosphoribosyltransferase family protein [Bacilli bacterium]
MICTSCLQEFSTTPIRGIIEKEPFLCDECISQIKIRLEHHLLFGIDCLFLSEYDGIIKKWLMDYKENLDIELAPCFLFVFLPLLRIKYAGWTFVPLPSNALRVEKRGFNHLEEMLKASKLNYLDCLIKEEMIQQKQLGPSERLSKKNIYLKKGIDLQGKKIVLFDDVYTSGGTLKNSLSSVIKAHPKEIKALILMNNGHFGEKSIQV